MEMLERVLPRSVPSVLDEFDRPIANLILDTPQAAGWRFSGDVSTPALCAALAQGYFAARARSSVSLIKRV